MTQDYNVSVSMNQAAVVKTGLVMKQGDFGFNLKITVLDFDTSNTTPQIVFRKPMGAVESTTLTKAGNVYTYVMKGTELDTPGKVYCDLKLKNSTTQRISSASFMFEVVADTLDGLAETASSYSDTVKTLLEGSFLLDRSKCTRITDPTDFDTITDEGNYYVGNTTEANTMTNIPIKRPGRLTVYSLMNEVYLQTYDANISGVCRRYWRVQNNGTWSDWEEITTVSNMNDTILSTLKEKTFLLNRNNAYRLNHTGETHPYKDITDFNDLITEGNYYLGNTSEASGMANIPIKKPGRLTVYSLLNAVIMQTYDANDNGVGKRYWRVQNNGTWSDWENATTDSNIGTAVLPTLKEKTFLLNRLNAYRLNHTGETHPYKDITDLNDLTTEGNYYLGNTPEASGMTNIPIGSPGRLTIYSLLNAVIMQTYDAYINGATRRFWRAGDTEQGTWGVWAEAATDKNFNSIAIPILRERTQLLNRNNAYRLNHTGETHPYKDITDLNDLITEGNYYLGNTPEARGMANIPIGSPGRLTIYSLLNAVIMQTYDAFVGGIVRRFWRSCEQGTWGNWEEMQNINISQYTMLEYNTEQLYPYTQGFIITDKYIYITNIYDNTSEIVKKFDKYTLSKIGELTFSGLIMHANDYTWEPNSKKIYCAIGGGTNNVCVFNEEFEYIETLTVLDNLEPGEIVSLSGIAYDTQTNLWVVSGGSSNKLFVLEDLDDESPADIIEYEGATFQGISAFKGLLWGITSGGNLSIFILDDSLGELGTVVQKTYMDGAYMETEGIQVLDDYIFFNIHEHESSKTILKRRLLAEVLLNPFLIQ